MAIKQDEAGVTIRVAMGFDCSAQTELELHFEAPSSSGTDVMKNTGDGVSLGSGVTDATLGTLAANTYIEYVTDGSEFDSETGLWKVCAVYKDSVTSTELEGDQATFTVEASNQVA